MNDEENIDDLENIIPNYSSMTVKEKEQALEGIYRRQYMTSHGFSYVDYKDVSTVDPKTSWEIPLTKKKKKIETVDDDDLEKELTTEEMEDMEHEENET